MVLGDHIQAGDAVKASALPAADFEPLDKATHDHHLALLTALGCARPVLYEGRQRFIQVATARQDGGRIEMVVYLAGDPAPIDASAVSLQKQSE